MMWLKHVKTMSWTTHDWDWFTPPIHLWWWLGMVYYCFNHTRSFFDIDLKLDDLWQAVKAPLDPKSILRFLSKETIQILMYPLVILHSYGKPALLLGKLTMSMAISHSYLTRGSPAQVCHTETAIQGTSRPPGDSLMRRSNFWTRMMVPGSPSRGSLYWLVEKAAHLIVIQIYS